MSDCPRTQSSRAASQEILLVAMKGGILVCLKQAISAPREVVFMLVGGRGPVVREFRFSNCVGARERGVVRTNGSRRGANRERRYMVLES